MTVNCYWHGRNKYKGYSTCDCMERRQLSLDLDLDEYPDLCTDCPYQFDGYKEDFSVNIRFKDATAIKKIIGIATSIIADFTFICEEGGLRLLAISQSNIIILRAFFSKEDLTSYDWSYHFAMTITSLDFSKLISKCKTHDKLELNFNLNGVKVNIFRNINKKEHLFKEFNLKQIDHPDNLIIDSSLSIALSNWEPYISIKTNLWTEIIGDLEDINEIIHLDVDEFGLHFYSGGNMGTGAVNLISNMLESFEHSEDIGALYGIGQLALCKNMNQIFKTMHICVNEGHPIVLFFDLDDKSYIQYLIAQRAEQDSGYDD